MAKGVKLKNNNNENIYPCPYFPVGSIYMSVNSINPSTYFGGTWVRWGKGRVPVGIDENDDDFKTVEKIGGSKKLQKHKHDVSPGMTLDETADGSFELYRLMWNTKGIKDWSTVTTMESGTGDSGNLQPYITCYMWCRTA